MDDNYFHVRDVIPFLLVFLALAVFVVSGLSFSFENKLERASYGYDGLASSYIDMCNKSDYPGETGYVKCLVDVSKDVVKYNSTGVDRILSSGEFQVRGGSCKEIAAFYSSLFRQLNWTIDYRFPVSRHVSITISKQLSTNTTWVYCDIELDRFNCVQVWNAEW